MLIKTVGIKTFFFLISLLTYIQAYSANICLSNLLQRWPRVDEKTGRLFLERFQNNNLNHSYNITMREQKSFFDKTKLNTIFNNLSKGYKDKQGRFQAIKLVEKDPPKIGFKNSTVTLYGKRITFKNQNTNTSMSLRYRFYAEVGKDSLGKTIFERAKITDHYGWCEVKIKNPSPNEINGVKKFRIRLDDHDIDRLIKIDPKDKHFLETISEIKLKANKIPGNKKNEVNAILDTIFEVGKIDPNFIKPKIISSLDRTAFVYDEPATGIYKNWGNVQYQISVDQNIKFYNPKKLVNKNLDLLNLENYLISTKNVSKSYPDSLALVEFKDPYHLSVRSHEHKSEVHQFFYQQLVSPMLKSVSPVFRPNLKINNSDEDQKKK